MAQNSDAVENIVDVNGLGSGFRETATGHVWLDYSNFRSQSFSSVQQSLVGTGFRIATKSEVQRLLTAVQQLTTIIGEIIPLGGGNAGVQRGFYDDGTTGSNATAVGLAAISQDSPPPSIVDDAESPDGSASLGAWVIQQVAANCESSPNSLDFDCDGRDEKVVWRPAIGTWFIRLSANNDLVQQQWGLPGDIPVSGDYDGDGVPDIAVWRPSNGTWYIKTSMTQYSAAQSVALQFGLPGDKPLRLDFDGDNRLDVGVWRPTDGNFYYVRSVDAQIVVQQFGLNGDIPVNSSAAQ